MCTEVLVESGDPPAEAQSPAVVASFSGASQSVWSLLRLLGVLVEIARSQRAGENGGAS